MRLCAQFLLALALGVTHVATTSAAESDSQAIIVTALKGDVRVTVNGQVRAVQKGTVIGLPATIQTGAQSSLDLKQDRTTVAIAADTKVELPASAAGMPLDRIVQSTGNAFYSVGKRESKKLRVETPYLVAVIKGTQFNVSVQGEGATVSLFEGRLEIRSPDDSAVVDLNAGEMAVRQNTDKSIRVMRMNSGEAVRPQTGNGDSAAAAPAPTTSHTDNATGTSATPGSASPIDRRVDDVLSGRNGGLSVSNSGLDAHVGVGGGEAGVGVDVSSNAIKAGVEIGVGSELTADLSTSVDTPVVEASVGANVGVGGGDVAVDLGANVGAGNIDVGVSAGIDAGNDGIGVDAGVGVDTGAVGADLSAGVDLGGGGAAIDVGTSVDVPVVGADVGADLGIDTGGGSIDVGLDTSIGADAPVDIAVDTGVDAGLDLGAGTIDVGADVSLDTPIGGTDVGLSAGNDGVDLGVDTGLGGIDLGVDLGIGTDGIDLGVDLGSGPPAAAPEPPSTGGLLGGVLGRLGRRN